MNKITLSTENKNPDTEDKKNTVRHLIQIACTILILSVGLLSGFFISKSTETCGEEFTLLDQHIDCEALKEKIIRVKNLEVDITKLIEQKKMKKEISDASVFYRDLNSRRWFAINADKDFYPASLLKLPAAIAYYKLAETNSEILSQKIKIPEDQKNQNLGQYFKVNSALSSGHEYTVEELIENLLVHSDNNAIQPLNQNMPSEYSYSVYRDLGLPEPIIVNNKSNWKLTVRIYAGILRALYISSYLSPEYSEKLLTYLTHATFDEGIKAAIPKNIQVAHKFGEAALLNPTDGAVEKRVLHDCGIIYNPDNPYILCIMTDGNEVTKLMKTIQDITKIVNGSIIPTKPDRDTDFTDDE